MNAVILAVLTVANGCASDALVKLSSDGRPLAQIVVSNDSQASTRFASEELTNTLETIVGAKFEITSDCAAISRPVVFVGASPSARIAFPEIDFSALAAEEIVIKSKKDCLLLAGGGTRGDIYAVSRFLQEQCGVRWWTPWAARIPKRPELFLGLLDIRYRSPFELRVPYFTPAFDPLWSVRNTCNGQMKPSIPPEMGGCVQYNGFVHTFYSLVPPETHFREHPEWFSLVRGTRVHDRAQLCLTNPQLREFVAEEVKRRLRETPEAAIVSVSQNDWDGACECGRCKLLEAREESPAGPIVDFANHVAAQIEGEFPDVLVDTLAYQYTRKAPKTTRPRANVVIRLCSDGGNLREPLDHASNRSFRDDIMAWARLTHRLHVWDYTANFAHYVQPHPNWLVLGPNVRFFAASGVKGVFAQGVDQSHGAEMAEMRAWVLAQLMWNPQLDDRELIREFLNGYFGPAAARHIQSYLDLMHQASAGYHLTTYAPSDAPFLQYEHLVGAERLWAQAEEAATDDAELLTRVRLARLPLRYVWLRRWDHLRQQAMESENPSWPLADSRERVIAEFRTVVQGERGRYWTQVPFVGPGVTPEDLLKGKVMKD